MHAQFICFLLVAKLLKGAVLIMFWILHLLYHLTDVHITENMRRKTKMFYGMDIDLSINVSFTTKLPINISTTLRFDNFAPLFWL